MQIKKFMNKHYIILVIILLIIFIVYRYFKIKAVTTTEGFVTGEKPKLLPVMSPLFNLRQMCIESALLEDHLSQEKLRCKDCQKKHFLKMEGLAHEMIGIDKTQEFRQFYDVPDKIRDIEKMYIQGKDQCEVAQELRKLRKRMMESNCFLKGIIPNEDINKYIEKDSRINNLAPELDSHTIPRSHMPNVDSNPHEKAMAYNEVKIGKGIFVKPYNELLPATF